MVEDDGPQRVEKSGPPAHTSRRASRIWPGVLLVIAVVILIAVVWWYSQRPDPSPLSAVRETPEAAAVDDDARATPKGPGAPVSVSGDEPDGPWVPDVVGDRRRAAEDAVRTAGYDVRVSTVRSASKASGFVVAQSPPAGTEMDAGGTVAIVVSAGASSAKSVRMPSIVGLTQASAESKVRAAGLVPYLIYGDIDVEEGRVFSQWPNAGESVPAGSEGFIQIQLDN